MSKRDDVGTLWDEALAAGNPGRRPYCGGITLRRIIVFQVTVRPSGAGQ